MTMPLHKFRPLLLCFLALATAPAIAAQQPDSGGPPSHQGPPPGPPPTAIQELARLDHALTLTEAQKTAILPILEKRRADMDALRQNSTDREANREQMRTLMETSRAAIRTQLTEAQQKTFDTMRPQRGPGPHGNGGNGNGPPAPPPDGTAPPPQD